MSENDEQSQLTSEERLARLDQYVERTVSGEAGAGEDEIPQPPVALPESQEPQPATPEVPGGGEIQEQEAPDLEATGEEPAEPVADEPAGALPASDGEPRPPTRDEIAAYLEREKQAKSATALFEEASSAAISRKATADRMVASLNEELGAIRNAHQAATAAGRDGLEESSLFQDVYARLREAKQVAARAEAESAALPDGERAFRDSVALYPELAGCERGYLSLLQGGGLHAMSASGFTGPEMVAAIRKRQAALAGDPAAPPAKAPAKKRPNPKHLMGPATTGAAPKRAPASNVVFTQDEEEQFPAIVSALKRLEESAR